jgi:hypothetical protein
LDAVLSGVTNSRKHHSKGCSIESAKKLMRNCWKSNEMQLVFQSDVGLSCRRSKQSRRNTGRMAIVYDEIGVAVEDVPISKRSK